MTENNLAREEAASLNFYGPFPTDSDPDPGHPVNLPLPGKLRGKSTRGKPLSIRKRLRETELQIRLVVVRLLKAARRMQNAATGSRLGTAALSRFRNSPRTAGILVGGVILAAVLLFWRKPSETVETADTTAEPAWKLEEVQVFPPSDVKLRAGALGIPKILQTSDDSAGQRIPGSNGESPPSREMRALPETPRAVWLTGGIEDINTESDIRRIGHVELPMNSRDRNAATTPSFPAYRRR